MSSVEFYRNTLPDWTALRALEGREVEAIVELLVALAQLGGWRIGSPAYAELNAAWVELFCESDWVARAALSAHVDTCNLRVRRLFEHPRAVDILLTSACTRLRASQTQFHALSLSIVTTLYSDSNQQQSDLVQQIGKRFNLSETRIDELFARLRAGFPNTQPQQTAGKPPPPQPPKKFRGRNNEKVNLSTDSAESPRR